MLNQIQRLVDGLSDHVSGAWRNFFTEPARIPDKAAYYHRIYIAAYKTWPSGPYDPQRNLPYRAESIFPDGPGAAVRLSHVTECKPQIKTGPSKWRVPALLGTHVLDRADLGFYRSHSALYLELFGKWHRRKYLVDKRWFEISKCCALCPEFSMGRYDNCIRSLISRSATKPNLIPHPKRSHLATLQTRSTRSGHGPRVCRPMCERPCQSPLL